MQTTITVPEENRYGVTFARNAHNAASSGDPIASDEAYIAHIIGTAVASWCDQANIVPPPPPSDPLVIDGVPQEVTRRQARQALIQAGKFDLVQQAIDAIADPLQRAMMQSEWDDSQTFQRQRATLIQMGTAIGLTNTDLDNLFKLAATL